MSATVPEISPQRLAEALRDADLDWQIVARIDSTNAELARRARAGVPRRTSLLVAEEQTAGRGRLGRTWQATPGQSLLFSLALPWPLAPQDSSAVTLACAAALARCLDTQGVPVQVKWPNDLLLHGRKLAGILTELVDDGTARTLVIGVGLNLHLDAARRAAIDQPAAALDEAAGAAGTAPEAWLGRLATALCAAAQSYARHGFGAVRDEFNAYCAFLGQAVTLRGGAPASAEGATALPSAAPAAAWQGILRGVDTAGCLLLESDGRLLAMMSGNLSLRPGEPRQPLLGESP